MSCLNSSRRLLGLAVCVCCLAVFGTAPLQAEGFLDKIRGYVVLPLQSLPYQKGGQAYAINQAGEVIGSVDVRVPGEPEMDYLVVWNLRGEIVNALPVAAPVFPALNDFTLAAGFFATRHSYQAALFGNDGLTLLETQGSSFARGITNDGYVVGSLNGSPTIWLTQNGNYNGEKLLLPVLPEWDHGHPQAINESHHVVGYLSNSGDGSSCTIGFPQCEAVEWINGEVYSLGYLGAPPGEIPSSKAVDVNDQGTVVGVSSTARPGTIAGFFRKAGGPLEEILGLSSGDSVISHVKAVNNQDIVVGYEAGGGGSLAPFLFDAEVGILDLAALRLRGGNLTVPYAINDFGIVAGMGWNGGGNMSPVLALPVLKGDLNCDGQADFGDINPFVMLLISQAEYEETYPACYWEAGDLNFDDLVDFRDINLFINLLMP